MHVNSRYILLLILGCAPFARADIPAPATSQQNAADRAKIAAELDSITSETAAKFNAHAPASDFDPLLARLSKLSLAPYRGMYNGGLTNDPDAIRATGIQQFIALWQDYLIQKDKDPATANNSLAQLVNLSATVTVVPRTALMALISKPEDIQAARQEKANERLDDLIKRVVTSIDAAKAPADLDSLFAELAKPDNSRNEGGFNSGRIQNLKYFVQNWQDYLSAVQGGRITDARNDLRGLENANYDTSFYPRSKILAALDALPASPPPPTLSLFKPNSVTLDNLDEFVSELAALRNNPTFNALNLGGLESAAINLRQAYISVTGGQGREVLSNPMMNLNPNGTGEYAGVLAELWSRVKLMAAPAAIEAPAAAKPTAQDNLSSYLERTLAAAIDAKDWALATRVLNVERITVPQMSGDASEDLTGLRALMVGINHEATGQWAEAVAWYTAALNTTGPHLPIRELSDRLHRIQKEHPDDYAAGLKLPDPSLLAPSPYTQRSLNQHGAFSQPGAAR